MGERLNYDEHFDWESDSAFKKPWKRKFLNQDFLKNERKRIEKAQDWRKKFRNTSEKDPLPDVELFTHDVREFYDGWSKPVYKEVGEYVLKVLSPLRNDNQIPIPALFPRDKVPEDFALLKIEESYKRILFNEKAERHANFLVVEDFSVLDPDERYLLADVDYEKQMVGDMLKDKMGYDDTSAQSLEAPLASSPATGKIGGVGMTSLDDNLGKVKDLFQTIERAAPFEYRTVDPPKGAEREVNGSNIRVCGANQ